MDCCSHHLVYGELSDFLTGERLVDTDDERMRQWLFRHLVEELGYAKGELEPRLVIDTGLGVCAVITLCARIRGKRLFILRYAPGSLTTREQPALAAARLLEPACRVPLAVITNGLDAELLDSATGTVLKRGMAAIPGRNEAERLVQTLSFQPFSDETRREQARRILAAFDRDECACGTRG